MAIRCEGCGVADDALPVDVGSAYRVPRYLRAIIRVEAGISLTWQALAGQRGAGPGRERSLPAAAGPSAALPARRTASLHWSRPAGYARAIQVHDESGPHHGSLSAQFDAWRYSESQYTLALELYQPGTEDRAAALRLARLRARADLRRDQFFGQALR